MLLGVVCVLACASLAPAVSASVLYIPLDERFTTRTAFLNLARLTPYAIDTPPVALLPSLRVPAPLDQLDAWVAAHQADTDAALVSAEILLYGSLIASRCSNDSTAVVLDRLDKLLTLKREDSTLLLATTIMRIPSYDTDFEDPWYWGEWGRDLYLYSYYTDEYNVTGNATCAQLAKAAEAQVPPAIVEQFLWRRARNHNVTVALLQKLATNAALKDVLVFVTLDDNAKYGFNIAEGRQLKDMIARLGLKDRVLVYDGADEIGLTMLSRLSTMRSASPVTFHVSYRNMSTIGLVPNFEGSPMVETLVSQATAAGVRLVNVTDGTNATLLINNFSVFPQVEAPAQTTTGRSVSDYELFTQVACAASPQRPVGFLDNRFSNGADLVFIDYIRGLAASCGLNISHFCYAGWNTDGNTIGTSVANLALLTLFGDNSASRNANTYFNVLRLVEDAKWQADLRQSLVAYIGQPVANDTVYTLNNDLEFYERYAFKVLSADTAAWAQLYSLDTVLLESYYPWNRTFEIGLVATR